MTRPAEDDPWLSRIKLLAEQLQAKAGELVEIVEAEQQERGANDEPTAE